MTICDVLVMAAGRGNRFGSHRPKQYHDLAGRPVLRHTIEAFAGHEAVRRVITVIGAGDSDAYAVATAGLDLPPPVQGGATRQASVLAGLEALAAEPPDLVAVHDGARPLVPLAAFETAIAAAQDPGMAGAIVAVPVSDSLQRVEAGVAAGSVARDGLWRVQTPQVFRFAPLLAAHRAAAPLAADERTALGDETTVAQRAGLAVAVVSGDAANLKITETGDIALAERLLSPRGETRTGFGFDAHAFAEGRELWLCGVRIEHGRGLAGHSDADVALHAATDAILGAIAEADIGAHFPPSDARWRGQTSSTFLAHAADLVRQRRGRIVHLDVTLVCEAPRIGPHRAAMRRRVAEICGIDEGRVSVKATTTERMGFTGRGEGIAAQAVATIELPA
jgi:2-C-methyl-D-erythritol 4-phosphate cytidylyltransferase/2-C-methyl-D-erythritol 2,4-cyclodiphosphate synthase